MRAPAPGPTVGASNERRKEMTDALMAGFFFAPIVVAALRRIPVYLGALFGILLPFLGPFGMAMAVCDPGEDIGCAAGFGMLMAVVAPISWVGLVIGLLLRWSYRTSES